jgi:hypothetical protein
LSGDLSKLTAEQRVSFYNRVCESLGLNPLTQPFAYLRLSGKEILYAKKDATEQLRFLHHISIDPKGFTREVIEGVYVVTAPASMPSGRTDVSTGAVPIDGITGEARANAMMKAETKAKRRVTLSICGLGMLDESEIESIQSWAPVDVNTSTGEIAEPVADLQPDQYYVRDVRELQRGEKNGRPWSLKGITVHTGKVFQTFDLSIAQAAERAKADGRAVEILTEKAKKGSGLKVVSLSPLFKPDEEKVL